MPDTSDAPATGIGPETDVRWHLEPYDADIDDAPKGDGAACTGGGDPVEGDDDGAP